MGIARIILLLINFVFTIIGSILGLRVLLRFFGANPDTPFVRWVYDSSDSLISPFAGIFPSPKFDGFVIDFPAIFALIIYLFVGYLIIEVVEIIATRSEVRMKKKK